MPPRLPSLIVALALAAPLSLARADDVKTVCTITVNSPDEKETLQRHLPPDRYRFHRAGRRRAGLTGSRRRAARACAATCS
jgi:hypothetical protein